MMLKKEPLFVRFMNKEVDVLNLIESYSSLEDPITKEAVQAAIKDPPNLISFRDEMAEAVRDLIQGGVGDEFKAFVNHYMEDSLEEVVEKKGENVSRIARVKDPKSSWMEGFICYNLVLFIKTFGLDSLKSCKVCGKIFSIKGKYAVYCSDNCKLNKKQNIDKENPDEKQDDLPGAAFRRGF